MRLQSVERPSEVIDSTSHLAQVGPPDSQILDVLDCSGSGDVDTSTEVDAVDGAVAGVFGERLALNPAWSNPSGAGLSWRAGGSGKDVGDMSKEDMDHPFVNHRT